MEPDVRDAVVDFVHTWQEKTRLKRGLFLRVLKLRRNKFRSWEARYGQANSHNGQVPRDWWLAPWEKEAIVSYHLAHPLVGYRALTYMMLDVDIVAVSPATTYRVLRAAGVLGRWQPGTSKRGTGFVQPLKPHEHWHMDIAYVNICSTFYYFIAVLDGYSRSVVHWDIREAMTEQDVELVLERAKELYPAARPRIITDNGKQFVAHDFKAFLRLSGMSHVRTSPYYPQSNGKVERFHGTLKRDCLRPKTPVSLADAKRVVAEFVEEYNTQRLHSAIGYITPQDKLHGREQEIFETRDRKLEAARARRKAAREHGLEAA